ncbi:MAG: hypothetical protein ACKO5Q_03805 [Microcystaceae cyanobacterium]
MSQPSLFPSEVNDTAFPNGLIGSELAARLGVNQSTISRNWDKWRNCHQVFSQWSKLSREDFQSLYPNESHNPKSRKIPDPDGLGWEKRGDRFFPIEK